MKRGIIFGVMIAIGAIVSFFTISGKDVGKFNDKLVDMVSDSNQRFTAIFATLDDYKGGQEIDVQRLKEQAAELGKNIEADNASVASLEVPDCDLCRRFHGSVNQYLAINKEYVVELDRVASYIAEHNPGKDADFQAVDEMLADEYAKEQQQLGLVSEQQAQMAKKYRLKLE